MSKAYLIGGGIASMAAAAFMIRDGGVAGKDITIFEALDTLGGSLDGSGSPETGYMLRGGRMLESKYLCTFGLLTSIPSLDGKTTVYQEILDWNERMKTSSHSRLVRGGQRQDAPKFGLSEKDILTIERIIVESEMSLRRTKISDQFDPAFFATDFWFMWCSTFAFQPWHSAVEFKRYLARFAHMISGFSRLEGIMRTPFNQYDSLVRPLQKWLTGKGVSFQTDTCVTNLDLSEHDGTKTVNRIFCEHEGAVSEVQVAGGDHVLVTLGSMTEASSLGSMDLAPVQLGKAKHGAWALWDAIDIEWPEFGSSNVFSGYIEESKWVSFTTTLRHPAFLKFVQNLTGNAPGEGGLITFPESGWLLSIVIPSQPHFIGQPHDVSVFWGYGLSVEKAGNFVKKAMSACTGREILTEVMGHLHIKDAADDILKTAICIPCMMPFITSQFLIREKGDRPMVIPTGWSNLAFIGQFCELPDDVVFTVEYSVRSAQTAVYAMLGLKNEIPAVYKGEFDPRVLYAAFRALHDLAA